MTLYKLKLRNGIREEYMVVNLDKFACAEALDPEGRSVRLHFEGIPHDTIVVDWGVWQDLKTRLLRMSQRGVNSLDREDPTGAEFDPFISTQHSIYDEIVRAVETMRPSETAYIASDMFTTGDTSSFVTATASRATTTGGTT